MKQKYKQFGQLTVVLVVVAALLTGCAALSVKKAEQQNPEQIMMASDWKFHSIVDASFVAQYATVPKPEGVMIIDSRPCKPKYVQGHIPTAINIPDSQFDKLKGHLPKDKGSLLIFYCGGYTWKLSHKSAWKAEKLGYTNVKVFAAGYPAYMKLPGSYTSISVEHLAAMLDANELILIDSRPKKAKYDKGHIPTAISIPDVDFEKLKGKLPANQETPLVFYCGGFTWKLSHKAARRAVEMGYRNVSVFAAGYPAWKQYAGTPAPTVAAVAAATEGEVIEIAAFEKLIKENPESILLIDVRDPDEYATGHFKTAINMPVDQLEKEVATLPADKPIVFVCSTGARSGESYYMLQDSRPELKNVQYLDATVTVKKDGSYEIKKNWIWLPERVLNRCCFGWQHPLFEAAASFRRSLFQFWPIKTRIWSPPFFARAFLWVMTGTGLLPYIRPLDERVLFPFGPWWTFARIVLIGYVAFIYLRAKQVLDTPV